MRTVAALCLVGVVLLGGAVIGTVITDGGGGDAIAEFEGTDDATHSGGPEHPAQADERRQGDGEVYGEADPEEDYQEDEEDEEEEEEEEEEEQEEEEETEEDRQETATPEQETATPTPEQETATPTAREQETATPTPERENTPRGQQQTPTPTRTPTRTRTPTPTEDDGDGSGWSPPFVGSDDDDGDDSTATPTPTPVRQTSTPAPMEETPTAEESARFEVVDATVGTTVVEVGEFVEVSAMVENRGSEGGTYEAELWVDGRVIEIEPVYVPAESVETVEFQTQFEEPGEYAVAVSGTEAGTVQVEPREVEGDGSIEVIDAVLPADAVRPGVETNVRATVENPNDRAVNATLVVTVDDEPVREVDISLDAGERTEVSIPFEAQEGTVAVNGVEAGELNVSEEIGSGDEADEEGPTERAGVRFGILAAIIVILGAISVAAAVHWQRYDETPLDQLGRNRP